MSLFNNNNKKKKGNKQGNQQNAKTGFSNLKGKANAKGMARNPKLSGSGGSQRGV
ncbi:MAG: hypothetical protein ACHQET_04760 [Chitinophagales bacterium]|jgi:hypothetical protein